MTLSCIKSRMRPQNIGTWMVWSLYAVIEVGDGDGISLALTRASRMLSSPLVQSTHADAVGNSEVRRQPSLDHIKAKAVHIELRLCVGEESRTPES